MYQVPRAVTLPGVPPVLLRMSRMYQVLRAVTPQRSPRFAPSKPKRLNVYKSKGRKKRLRLPSPPRPDVESEVHER